MENKHFRKHLFSLSGEGVQIHQSLAFTDIDKKWGISTGMQKNDKSGFGNSFWWKPEGKLMQTKLPKVQPGNVRHHVAYDFKRPEAFLVEIPRSLHGQIHNPKGCHFGEYGYSLID